MPESSVFDRPKSEIIIFDSWNAEVIRRTREGREKYLQGETDLIRVVIEKILRFEISMDDSVVMHVLNCSEHLNLSILVFDRIPNIYLCAPEYSSLRSCPKTHKNGQFLRKETLLISAVQWNYRSFPSSFVFLSIVFNRWCRANSRKINDVGECLCAMGRYSHAVSLCHLSRSKEGTDLLDQKTRVLLSVTALCDDSIEQLTTWMN